MDVSKGFGWASLLNIFKEAFTFYIFLLFGNSGTNYCVVFSAIFPSVSIRFSLLFAYFLILLIVFCVILAMAYDLSMTLVAFYILLLVGNTWCNPCATFYTVFPSVPTMFPPLFDYVLMFLNALFAICAIFYVLSMISVNYWTFLFPGAMVCTPLVMFFARPPIDDTMFNGFVDFFCITG